MVRQHYRGRVRTSLGINGLMGHDGTFFANETANRTSPSARPVSPSTCSAAARRLRSSCAIAVLAISLAACSSGPSDSERAEAAASRAKVAYLEAARPSLESIFDVVQPLESALELGSRGNEAALKDLIRDGQTARRVGTARESFHRVVVPAGLADSAAAVFAALGGVQTQAAELEKTSTQDLLPSAVFDVRFPAVGAAVGVLQRTEKELYSSGSTPSLPGINGGEPNPAERKPLSQASYLLAVGTTCGEADKTLEPLRDASDAQVAAQAATVVGAYQRVFDSLKSTPAPSGDAAKVKENVADRVAQSQDLLDSFLAGSKDIAAGNEVAGRDKFSKAEGSLPTMQKVVAALRVYGSTSCADLLDELVS